MLAVNIFILINRNNGYKYFPYKTYNYLYVTDSTLYLQNLQFDADPIKLFFSTKLPSAKYKVVVDDSLPGEIAAPVRNSICFSLKENIHQYKLIATNQGAGIIIQADHSKNTRGEYINEFIYCNLPGPQIKVSSYNLWTKGIESFTAEEIKNGIDFFKRNTKAVSATTDSARLMEVCRLMATLRPNFRGIKAEKVSSLSPYRQLQLSLQNKVNLDCGNYSAMLYYFCSILHLPNRIVTFSGPAGNWRYGVHYYNEIYLREKQQWVLCDGLTNIYMPHDSVRFYNAADVNDMAHLNSFKNKSVYTFDNGTLKRISYDSLNYWHWYYNRNNADLRYLHPGRNQFDTKWNYLTDFYSFERNFDLYSNKNENNWLKIIIKTAVFYLTLITLSFYFLFELNTLSKKHSNRLG